MVQKKRPLKNSKIINNKGEIIFVTNTDTVINLENNEIINNDSTGGFLRIGAAKWGTSGSNGGDVTLNAVSQTITGEIFVDNISTLEMKLGNGSKYTGMINADNSAKKISISLDSNSTLTLTGDSYITALGNEVSDNSNINLNGHTLYVNETAITSTNYTGNKTTETENSLTESETTSTNQNSEVNQESELSNATIMVIVAIAVIVFVVAIILILKNKKSN